MLFFTRCIGEKLYPKPIFYTKISGLEKGVTGVKDLRGPGPQMAPGGPGKSKLHALKDGPGRPNHAPEGPWKVVYGCVPADFWSDPGKCKRAQIAIKSRLCFRKDENGGLLGLLGLLGTQRFSGCQRFLGPGFLLPLYPLLFPGP
jgi:hypothetical protein